MATRALRLKTATRVALLLILVAACTACGRGVTSTPGDAPNLEKWVAEVKNRPAPPLEPLPVMQQFETFEYDAQSLRDPFSNAFSDDSGGSGPRPDPNRP
jgi:type IV pilus assembly protein PilP